MPQKEVHKEHHDDKLGASITELEERYGLKDRTPRRIFMQNLGKVIVNAAAGATILGLLKSRSERIQVTEEVQGTITEVEPLREGERLGLRMSLATEGARTRANIIPVPPEDREGTRKIGEISGSGKGTRLSILAEEGQKDPATGTLNVRHTQVRIIRDHQAH
ncbi:hypothetical protein ACFLRF_06115 [Candidatus Altiarchaeota archaeon]